jgi:flagellar protein FlaG
MLIQNVTTNTLRLASDSAPISVSAPSQRNEASRAAQPEAPAAAAKKTATNELSAGQLQSAVDSINKSLKEVNPSLEFSIDNDTSLTVVKLVEKQSGEVIRQVPTEEALAIAKAIDKFQKGMLLTKEA